MSAWQSWIAWAIVRATVFALASLLFIHDWQACLMFWFAFTALDLACTRDRAMDRERLEMDLRNQARRDRIRMEDR